MLREPTLEGCQVSLRPFLLTFILIGCAAAMTVDSSTPFSDVLLRDVVSPNPTGTIALEVFEGRYLTLLFRDLDVGVLVEVLVRRATRVVLISGFPTITLLLELDDPLCIGTIGRKCGGLARQLNR
ncbi:MAG TPA: hypothetical protein VD835_15250, partial [Pyrinomonadaceae bacterium]|nr:hypothetical protein [Pyrinomonadaceae bacterium]